MNVIGEHTDYTSGLALPMAIDRGTTVRVSRGDDWVRLFSDREHHAAVVPLDVTDPSALEPGWARYVTEMVAELRREIGAVGTVSTTLPVWGCRSCCTRHRRGTRWGPDENRK